LKKSGGKPSPPARMRGGHGKSNGPAGGEGEKAGAVPVRNATTRATRLRPAGCEAEDGPAGLRPSAGDDAPAAAGSPGLPRDPARRPHLGVVYSG
jgi:hypothetical protein